MVMRNLGKQMMDHMGANVMVNLVKDAIITVNSAQATTQVAPLLATVPGDL